MNQLRNKRLWIASCRGGQSAFSLIELLVVIAIIALLTGILLPSLSAAKELAKAAKAIVELRGIGNVLELYAEENELAYPPARTYCQADQWKHSCQLPVELVHAKLLSSGITGTGMSADMEDVFNPGYTYKYQKPGLGMHNDAYVIKSVWVPDTFPNDLANDDPDTLAGKSYDNFWQPKDDNGNLVSSPVSWVVWSVGPGHDPEEGSPTHAPIPRCTWYKGRNTGGVIPLIKTAKGANIGYAK